MQKTMNQIEADMIDAAIRRNLNNYVGPGSVTRELISMVASEVAELYRSQADYEKQSRISEASRSGLEAQGRDIGLSRGQYRPATSRMNDRNVSIETTGATFGELGITRDNLLSTTLSDKTGNVVFAIEEVPPSISSLTKVYVGVTSAGTRSIEVRAGDLTTINSTSYRNVLRVNNQYPLFNMSVEEDLDSYRSRLQNEFTAREACNEVTLRNYLNGFAGIGKFNIIWNWNGSASIAVVIQPRVGIMLSPSALNELQSALRSKVAAGTTIEVINPILIYMKLRTRIFTTRILNNTEKAALRNRMNASVLSYLNLLEVGQSISNDQLVSQIKRSSPLIERVGPGDSVEEMWVSYKDDSATYTSNVEGAIEVKDYELLVLDSDPFDWEII